MRLALPLLLALAAAAAAEDASLDDKLKAAGEKGQSLETGEMLAEDAIAGDKIETRVLKLKGADIAKTFIVAENGSEIILADRAGWVRKVDLPSWKESRRLWVGKAVTCLAKCKDGVLATVPDNKELLLLKDDFLTVQYRWKLDEASAVYATPHGSAAWVPKTERGIATVLQAISLETKGMQKPIDALEIMKAQGEKYTYRRHPTAKQLSTFENIVVSPKGDYLLCSSGDCLFRFRIEGCWLAIDDASAPLGRLTHIALSPDGVSVAVTAPDKGPDGWPVAKAPGALIFKARDLMKPTGAVDNFRVWGFTRSAEKVFGTRDPNFFAVQTAKGKVDRDIELTGTAAGVVDVEACGEGGKYLVHQGDKLVWVWFK